MKKRISAAKSPINLAINQELTEELLGDFIRRETLRAGFQRVLLGISGGIDSAVVLALAVKALGADSVLGILMPYRTSAPSSLRDGREVVQRFGVTSHEIEITGMVDAYLNLLPKSDRVRKGNKMARERMSILYDLSSAHKALVLGTSNKTELLLGYGTQFGDLASALNPVGDLYKSQLRQLARHLEIPPRILKKTPSADLWPGQTDEKELGFSYPRVDRLLYFLVDLRGTPEEAVAQGFSKRMVTQVLERIRRSQFKRRMPLIAKVSNRTVGIDFRYPRDWGT